MFADVDLRELAELTAPERTFLTVYLESPRSLKGPNKQLDRLRPALSGADKWLHSGSRAPRASCPCTGDTPVAPTVQSFFSPA